MLNEKYTRIDLTVVRTIKKWQLLLDSVMRNDVEMDREEQDYYIKEIRYKIFGQPSPQKEILEQIKAGEAEAPKMD